MSDSERRWVNSCELNFRVKNVLENNVLVILGFYFDYSILKSETVSSFLEIPQGDYGIGEAVCFACSF